MQRGCAGLLSVFVWLSPLTAPLIGACAADDVVDANSADDDDDEGGEGEGEGELPALPPLPEGIFGLVTPEFDDAANNDDLAAFYELTAAADVVALGESVHTSGGFYALKERLIRNLVVEQGVRVLGIETPRTAAEALNAWVHGTGDSEPCSLAAAARVTNGAVFPVFVDDNFVAMLNALCVFNTEHPGDQVSVVGFDAQQPYDDQPAIAAALQRFAPDDSERLLAALTTCALDYETEFTAEAYDTCVAGLSALTDFIDSNEAAFAVVDADALQTLRIDVMSLASWQDERHFEDLDMTRSYTVRDRAMAAILLDLRARRFPGERIVVWAHDTHISMDYDAEPHAFLLNYHTMGSVLHDTLGPAYQAYAINAVETAINWPGVGTGSQPSPFGGLEETVADLLVPDRREAVLVTRSSTELQEIHDLGTWFQSASLTNNFMGVFVLRTSPGMDAVWW